MSDKDQRIWEALKLYKNPQLKPGYVGRFWSRLAQQERSQPKILGVFMPKPWAFGSMALTVFLVIGFFSFNNQQMSYKAAYDPEMINNLDVAKHWQGIEHVDVLDDLDIIEKIDLKQGS